MADETGVAAIRGNGFDPAITRAYVERIENLANDLASERGESMQRCGAIHKDIAAVYDEAKKSGGIPKKALKMAVKKRALEAKVKQIRDELEGDDADNYDAILLALGELGDTPLGEAALTKAKESQTAAATA